jgi:chain length determinant protein EpsF
MNIAQFLAILRARWWVVVAVLAVTVATATLVSLYLIAPKYTATASVVVDVKPDPVSGVVYQGSNSSAVIATQVDILKSERVMRRVIRNTRIGEAQSTRDAWLEATGGEGSIEQWLISQFVQNLEVVPSTSSNVILVRYSSGSAQGAAQMANAFVQAYLETTMELRIDPARQYSGFFQGQVKEARDNLERASAKLSAFQRERGLLATDERMDIESARLNELSSQLVALQGLTAESGSRQAQVRNSADRMQEVIANPLINNLKAELTKAEGQLQQLDQRLGDNHPQVVEARASVADLRRRIDAEVQRVSGGVGVTASINRAREAEIRASLEAQRARVLKLKELRDEAAVLLRDLDNAQRTYDALLTKANQTAMESQNTQNNVYLLTEAAPPVTPSSPNVKLNVALAVFLGGLLALGTALALELIDRRVRTFDDVVASLDLPVIGVMPKPGAKRLVGRKKLTQMQQRVLGHGGGTPLLGGSA